MLDYFQFMQEVQLAQDNPTIQLLYKSVKNEISTLYAQKDFIEKVAKAKNLVLEEKIEVQKA